MPNLSNFKHSMNNKNDELYTPEILVNAIIPYIDKSKTVWCPFDTSNSEFVTILQKNNINVVYSHIADGKDFFKYEPEHYDIIISNPPFSRKLEVFERLYLLNKPFAVLMGLPILNYQEVGKYFYDKDSDIQFLIVDKKVSYNGNTSSFNTSYFCRNFLPKDVIFTHLEHNNSNKYYKASAMENDRCKINAR